MEEFWTALYYNRNSLIFHAIIPALIVMILLPTICSWRGCTVSSTKCPPNLFETFATFLSLGTTDDGAVTTGPLCSKLWRSV